MDSPPIYNRRMRHEYAFFRWLTENNISGVIYSWTLLTESAEGFLDLLPYYEYLVDLKDAQGEAIDMEKFKASFPDKKDSQYLLLAPVVKPRRTMMATDEVHRATPPKIGDKVEFVFRANSSPNSANDRSLQTYLVKARRIAE